MWLGASSRSRLISMAVKPYTALVVSPPRVLKFSAGSAEKARKGSELPSSSISVGLVWTPLASTSDVGAGTALTLGTRCDGLCARTSPAAELQHVSVLRFRWVRWPGARGHPPRTCDRRMVCHRHHR